MLSAGPGAHERIVGRNEAPAFLSTVHDAMQHALRARLLHGPVLPGSEALANYLAVTIGHLPSEQVRVLFLDARNRLIRDETVAQGSIDRTPIYPREILKRALELGSAALILVHNHPTGDLTPSDADLHATAKIIEAGAALDIAIHDHVIVGPSGWASLRALGFLK